VTTDRLKKATLVKENDVSGRNITCSCMLKDDYGYRSVGTGIATQRAVDEVCACFQDYHVFSPPLPYARSL
jgi:hypothetical protein